MPDSLMEQIREYVVPAKSVALWWLGQNGYIFKTPEGTLAAVDLYLTDSCAGTAPGIDLSRQFPVYIAPEELQVDLFVCTHNHQDHTDPETIRGLREKAKMQFVGPAPSCPVFRAEGVPEANIVTAWPDCEIKFRDVTLRGTFAVPTDDSDLNHMGFVFDFAGGPKIWVTGDTDFHELLYSAAKHKPDVMIVCINCGFNNLSHWEAAQVAAAVKPKAAIPCHYDLFRDNSVDPRQFKVALACQAPGVKYQELEHARAVLIQA
jgi:L-ascorbate 6-phosphate lactonase